MVSLFDILRLAHAKNASDIHIVSGSPPVLRLDGQIFQLDTDPLNDEETKAMCYSLISDEQKSRFENQKHLDFSFFLKDTARFRGALFFQKGSVAGVFRTLRMTPPQTTDLFLPPSINRVIEYPYGLVLITGPTGSGKSTTLSAIINAINETRQANILTLEDPIEIIHPHKNCIVSQRELGTDFHSFVEGMQTALRIDPDICLVGEMRDRQTIELALKMAETGHLVFSTLHTNSAAKTIDRIVSSFPTDAKEIVCNQLSTLLQAVISQRLIKTKTEGRRIATEILFSNSAVSNLIREGKIFQLYSVIQTNFHTGMMTMNQSLVELIKEGIITSKSAFEITPEKEELYQLLKKVKIVA